MSCNVKDSTALLSTFTFLLLCRPFFNGLLAPSSRGGGSAARAALRAPVFAPPELRRGEPGAREAAASSRGGQPCPTSERQRPVFTHNPKAAVLSVSAALRDKKKGRYTRDPQTDFRGQDSLDTSGTLPGQDPLLSCGRGRTTGQGESYNGNGPRKSPSCGRRRGRLLLLPKFTGLLGSLSDYRSGNNAPSYSP